MDFKNASLDELKQFVKEHKIKGVSALRKSALIEFLEKNYNGETDHTAEINEAKPQKADAEKKKSIQEKEKQMALSKKDKESRLAKIKVLANKIANMPPPKAKELLENWPDQDIIDVLKQMDKDAEEEGTNTITTYLLTLFDEKRRAVITNKWLDHEADRIPDENASVISE